MINDHWGVCRSDTPHSHRRARLSNYRSFALCQGYENFLQAKIFLDPTGNLDKAHFRWCSPSVARNSKSISRFEAPHHTKIVPPKTIHYRAESRQFFMARNLKSISRETAKKIDWTDREAIKKKVLNGCIASIGLCTPTLGKYSQCRSIASIALCTYT